MIQRLIMIQATATIVAIVDTQIISMTYSFPAAYSHRQTNAPKNAATDTPNHSTGSQP